MVLRLKFISSYRMSSFDCVQDLLTHVTQYELSEQQISELCTQIILNVKKEKVKTFSVSRLLTLYQLNSPEGRALLTLSEALLRIPDKSTKKQLIKDVFANKDWKTSKEFPILSKMIRISEKTSNFDLALSLMVPLVQQFVNKLGNQFVFAETIKKAIKKNSKLVSYDMLGEAALILEDADKFFGLYEEAILEMKANSENTISVKLSALDPQFNYVHYESIKPRLMEKVCKLATLAKNKNIALTIDAEESDRFDITLDVVETLLRDGFDNIGIAVQAYQKRAFTLIEHLDELTNELKIQLSVRLVKGAYWDSEIKWAQELGLDFPVFTKKEVTDLSYIACTERLFKCEYIYPQFGTHNAHTIASILTLAGDADFELQKLHGMGDEIYKYIEDKKLAKVRNYVPIGQYKELLPYLVRRLLENGANTSFISMVFNRGVDFLSKSPVKKIREMQNYDSEVIKNYRDIYTGRKNSSGLDLSDKERRDNLEMFVREFSMPKNPPREQIPNINGWEKCFEIWKNVSIEKRADLLEKVADKMEDKMIDLISLCVHEAHKTIPDSISEVREAVDFLRYYAQQGRELFKENVLESVVGEENKTVYHPRGLWLCISPWNFPVAIFTGQIAASLVCGNIVIAKPAEQTQRIAKYVVDLFYEVGFDENVLRLAFGNGAVGNTLVKDERFAGISFTGGTDTAKIIAKAQLEREAPLGKLIAETGGINAMLVDSTALPEQVIEDVIHSSFNSAGQRCSALRVLLLQDEIYDEFLERLGKRLTEITIGDPAKITTDVGPLIDTDTRELIAEKVRVELADKKLYKWNNTCTTENFYPPRIYLLDELGEVKSEIFGPLLRVIKWDTKNLDKIIFDLNQMNFNLTFGVHSRLDSRIKYIEKNVRAGTIYVNRNQIGAVVGSQPFGGSGYSGTGPKAGGENYLLAFVIEKTISNNTTAMGGNASLVMIDE